MQTVGVICEYNPFHLGHARQLSLIRQQLEPETAIVCLMSGTYVQRGEPAIFDKRVRAQAAVEAGASLVLELPVTYALRSAEGFAAGGVHVLSQLRCGFLSFGCESGDGAAIFRAAEVSCSVEFEQALHVRIQTGLSYAAARQRALEALGQDGQLLTRPNDILAFEYCRAILTQNSHMHPLAVLRPGDYHADAPDAEHPSATAVRQLILSGGDWRQYVPAACTYENAVPHALLWGEKALLARLRGMEQADWVQAAHGSEGLWSKVWKAVQAQPDYERVLEASKSKRYPRTRLQRLLLCAYLGIDTQTLLREAPYVRVLAFDEMGRTVLRQAKKDARQCGPDAAGRSLLCAGAPLCSALRPVCHAAGTFFGTSCTDLSKASGTGIDHENGHPRKVGMSVFMQHQSGQRRSS